MMKETFLLDSKEATYVVEQLLKRSAILNQKIRDYERDPLNYINVAPKGEFDLYSTILDETQEYKDWVNESNRCTRIWKSMQNQMSLYEGLTPWRIDEDGDN